MHIDASLFLPSDSVCQGKCVCVICFLIQSLCTEMWSSSIWECLTDPLLLLVAALGSHVLDMEKPVVFTYEEISSSADGFSDSRLLGHGTYGSVYYGLLREQVCSFVLCFPYSTFSFTI